MARQKGQDDGDGTAHLKGELPVSVLSRALSHTTVSSVRAGQFCLRRMLHVCRRDVCFSFARRLFCAVDLQYTLISFIVYFAIYIRFPGL